MVLFDSGGPSWFQWPILFVAIPLVVLFLWYKDWRMKKLVDIICPVCNEGQLIEGKHSQYIKHNGSVIKVENLENYECDKCNATPILPDQISRNHVRIADAK